MMRVRNNLPTDNAAGGIRLGVIVARDVDPMAQLPGLDQSLDELLSDIASAASVNTELREQRRLAARDMLRNGRYKPTGRGKPASEYLQRSAVEGSFPRINALVDINNLVSLATSLPISLWDLDAAGAASMVFRLGKTDERYEFNASGQVLELEDLVVGCVGASDDDGVPIVSPIKDSQRTKTHDHTESCGVAIYAPSNVVSATELHNICEEFRGWLMQTGSSVAATSTVLNEGEEVDLE